MSFQVPSLPLTEAGWVFALLFALILLVPGLCQRARVPVVVGFVLAGMLVGPGVAGLLERAGGVELLGSAGLLYLMFIAGLELDLDEFIAHRSAAFTFGVTSFLVPMLLGTPAMLALGFTPLAAVLLASCWASHTLIAYPEYRRVGTARNRAVSVTVGATILTDTAALLVLAVIAGMHQGAIGPAFWLTLVPGMVALVAIALWVLPALGRRFFSGLGQDTAPRFLFVATMVFGFAGLAQLAGIEGIVGAFLAGLAMNRLVPHRSRLMERLEFFGNQFMIPAFLISVGLLIDPRVILDPQVLLVGGAFTAVALLTKFAAAEGTGRVFGYNRPELGSMFALSSAQAAATLAAVLVGVRIELIDTTTLNAVVAVIAVTCLLSSWLGNRYAGQLPPPAPRAELGATVVVPVANPASAHALVRLAATMARPDAGTVVPVTVAPPDADEATIDRVTAAKEKATSMALSHGVEAEGVVRIDSAPHTGIRHTVVERRASLMVVGWKGSTTRREALFGGILDNIVAQVDVPTIIARSESEPVDRILLAVPAALTRPTAQSSFALAVETVRRLRRQIGRRVAVIADQHSDAVAQIAEELLGGTYEAHPRGIVAALQRSTQPGDLIVLPVERRTDRVPDLAVRVARQFVDRPLLIVMDGATRRVGDLRHEALSSEHPFGPPPWARSSPGSDS